MLRLAAFLAALAASPCLAQPRPAFADGTDPRDRRAMLQLFEGLHKACPNTATYAKAFKDITLMDQGSFNGAARRLGWKASMLVTIHIADGSAFMPAGLANTPDFSFARFFIGGSPHPGVVAWSPGARLLCGLPAALQDQDEPFLPVPSLGFFKDWAPDLHPVPASGLDGTAIGLDDPSIQPQEDPKKRPGR